MLFAAAGGQTEVSKFDMASSVEQDIVGLDVTGRVSISLAVVDSVFSTYRCRKPSLCTASIAMTISAI